MEEKFYRRFESFKNSLDALNEAKTMKGFNYEIFTQKYVIRTGIQ